MSTSSILRDQTTRVGFNDAELEAPSESQLVEESESESDEAESDAEAHSSRSADPKQEEEAVDAEKAGSGQAATGASALSTSVAEEAVEALAAVVRPMLAVPLLERVPRDTLVHVILYCKLEHQYIIKSANYSKLQSQNV